MVDTDGGAAEKSSEVCDHVDADERGAFAGSFTSRMRGGTIDNPLGPMERKCCDWENTAFVL